MYLGGIRKTVIFTNKKLISEINEMRSNFTFVSSLA